jgi:hypothetical protein
VVAHRANSLASAKPETGSDLLPRFALLCLPRTPHFFNRAQVRATVYPLVPSASGVTVTMSGSANRPCFGTVQRWSGPGATARGSSSTAAKRFFASAGSAQAASSIMSLATSALDVEARITALRDAISHRKYNPVTLLNWAAWHDMLSDSGLLDKYYRHIPSSI